MDEVKPQRVYLKLDFLTDGFFFVSFCLNVNSLEKQWVLLFWWHFTQEYTPVNCIWLIHIEFVLQSSATEWTTQLQFIDLYCTLFYSTILHHTLHCKPALHCNTLQFTAWYKRWQNTISKSANWHMLVMGKISRNLSAYQCTGVSQVFGFFFNSKFDPINPK